MLFILDGSGVPSVAKVVQITGSAPLPPLPAVPAAPTALSATSPNSQQITLSWEDNSTNEAAFHVERCEGAGCSTFATIARLDPNATRYANLSLTSGTTDSYRVRAENGSGFSGYSNTVTATVSTGPGRAGAAVTHRPSNRCMDVSGGDQTAGTPIALQDCTGAANQRWVLPAAGTAGRILVYDLMCLDAASGAGNDGDAIIIWSCNGQANQQWTLTAAGEWQGINGKCIDTSEGGTANGTRLVLATCTGVSCQQWDVDID